MKTRCIWVKGVKWYEWILGGKGRFKSLNWSPGSTLWAVDLYRKLLSATDTPESPSQENQKCRLRKHFEPPFYFSCAGIGPLQINSKTKRYLELTNQTYGFLNRCGAGRKRRERKRKKKGRQNISEPPILNFPSQLCKPTRFSLCVVPCQQTRAGGQGS